MSQLPSCSPYPGQQRGDTLKGLLPWSNRYTKKKRSLQAAEGLYHRLVLLVGETGSGFLMNDTRALVKMIELFNRVHELETALTDEQLRAILLRTDSWLMYILQISVGNFHK